MITGIPSPNRCFRVKRNMEEDLLIIESQFDGRYYAIVDTYEYDTVAYGALFPEDICDQFNIDMEVFEKLKLL